MLATVKIKNHTSTMSSFYNPVTGGTTPLPPDKEVCFELREEEFEVSVPQLVQLTLRQTSGESDFAVDVDPPKGL